jgi:hypothetical protein
MSYKLHFAGCITRLKDGASIPPRPDNVDYQEYLAWEAKGNTPLPAFTEEELSANAEAAKVAEAEVLISEKMRVIAKEALVKEGKLSDDGKVIKQEVK